jgi:hypothetical protein
LARTLILTVSIAAFAGCAAKHGSGAPHQNQGSPLPSAAAPTSGKRLTGGEWLRDNLYDSTIHSRGRPDDYNQPIYAPGL